MKIPMKKAWVAALGVALAVSTAGGVAVAAGAGDWYTGGNAAVPDHDQTSVALKLYNAAGTEVTSGSINAPIAAFAAAGGAVRSGDTFATLFVHLPESDTAPGAWPGLQASGTGKFSGSGAAAAPASLAGKPYVATTGGYTLADVAKAYPNKETKASFAGVYELRLRTSSPTAGVSTEYAAAFVKVTGSTWQVTGAPVLGDATGGVATSVSATWPTGLTYGKPASVAVKVAATSGSAKPTGTVKLVSGAKTLATATLSGGAATLTVSKVALVPGTASLQVVYPGAGEAFAPSSSAVQSLAVAKGATGQPTFKVTKAPTSSAGGKATVTVPTSSGLVTASGGVEVVLTKGSKTLRATATLKAGKAVVKLPKLAAGAWKVTVGYAGDSYYKPATSKTYKVTV